MNDSKEIQTNKPNCEITSIEGLLQLPTNMSEPACRTVWTTIIDCIDSIKPKSRSKWRGVRAISVLYYDWWCRRAKPTRTKIQTAIWLKTVGDPLAA